MTQRVAEIAEQLVRSVRTDEAHVPLQQAGTWGWTSVATIGSTAVGALLLAVFVVYELRQAEPLIRVRLFARRGFAADNAVLLLMSAVFVPFFFFASVYAQASLGESATKAGTFLLVFFAGYAAAAQWGGRVVDKRGARPAILLGCALSAVGFYVWGTKLTGLEFGTQWLYVAIAGAGLGLVLGPVSTDALNRTPDAGYGEITGITQTVRNLGASLGLAVMGSIFVGAEAGPTAVAGSTQTVASIMAAAFVVAKVGLPKERRGPSSLSASAALARQGVSRP